MRLLPSEHKDIMDLLIKAGLEKEIQLTKKTGWVHLQHIYKVFSFHRKKVTRLENGQFTDSIEYFTGTPKKPEKAPDWAHVVEQLKLWLNK